MNYSLLGIELDNAIRQLEISHTYSEVINYVIMPNHVHLLISIKGAEIESARTGCLRPPAHGEECTNKHHNSLLARCVNHLKGRITKFANKKHRPFKWQSRFYDNIILSQSQYELVMNYIDSNVASWVRDRFYRAIYGRSIDNKH